MRRLVLGIFAVVVVGILFLVLCTFVRRPYEKVLLDRFGNIIEEKDQRRIAYNWYFKLPTDSVVRMDTRLHMYTSPLQEIVTGGSEPISVKTYAAWRLMDPVKFYRTTRGSDDRAKQIMGQKISGLVQSKLAGHKLDEIFNLDESKVHTQEIEAEVAREVSRRARPIPRTGGNQRRNSATGVGDRADRFFASGVPAGQCGVCLSAHGRGTQRAGHKISQQGDSEANALKQQGDTDATKIRSEAVKKSEEIRGQGDRQALGDSGGVQQSPAARDFYQYWKSMEFIKTSLAKNTIFVLPTDTDWLKSLFVVPVNRATAGLRRNRQNNRRK